MGIKQRCCGLSMSTGIRAQPMTVRGAISNIIKLFRQVSGSLPLSVLVILPSCLH
jgi:hypothetical protein